MFPQYLPNRLSLAYARTSISLAARRATRVLTVSESSKRDILRFVDVPPANIDVIYNSYDERFGVEPKEEDVVRVRERYQLHDPLRALRGQREAAQEPGAADRGLSPGARPRPRSPQAGAHRRRHLQVHRASPSRPSAPAPPSYVRFLGYLPEETLAVMYRLAGVFVFPSLYEGFGLPPLEAMASGTPVVTSNVSSLPEVAGDAAVLVDPYDTRAIADGIYRVLTDQRLRAELKRAGSRAPASSRGNRRCGACARSTDRSRDDDARH